MSLIALGVSHRTAPVPMLERLALPPTPRPSCCTSSPRTPSVDEAMVVATCNRVEVYVEADKFHPAVDAATEGLARATGVSPDELVPHLYVHYEDRAVQHLFSVASGLDSMVVGEAQILGQVRQSLRTAQDEGSARARAQRPRPDRAAGRASAPTPRPASTRPGASLVSVGSRRSPTGRSSGLAGRTALVVGAGSMASLAAATASRARACASSSSTAPPERAAAAGVAAVGRRSLLARRSSDGIAEADLVVSCTGRSGSRRRRRRRRRGPRAAPVNSPAGAARPRDAARHRPRGAGCATASR